MREYKFPKVLNSLLKENHMSQQKLADKIHTTQGAVYRWLKTDTMPCVYTLMEISEVFDVSIDYLLFGVDR